MKTEARVGLFIIVAIGIFFYLSFNIGEFRFDGDRYAFYTTVFEDTGGLELKSPVKIAGVNVGWVNAIKLLEGGRAEIVLRVHRRQKLARNAYATISQDGLIGSKTIEIDPGDPSTGLLVPGSQLAMPGKSPSSISDLLESLQEITDSVQDVVTVFKGTFASQKGEKLLNNTVINVEHASDKVSDFSDKLALTMDINQEKVNNVMTNLEGGSTSLAKGIPEVSDAVTTAGRDASATFTKFGTAADSANDAFINTSQAAQKINHGQGTLGKLINDSQLHTDIHDTVKGVKTFVGKAQQFKIEVDLSFYSYLANDDSRGCGQFKLQTQQDYFYNLEFSNDNRGKTSRMIEYNDFFDSNGNQLNADTTGLTDEEKARYLIARKEVTRQDQSKYLIGFQFARKYKNLTMRIGVIEQTAGMAVDFRVPLNSPYVTWDTSIEAFDLSGYNRIDDDRPWIRWKNKVSFNRHIYTTFGFEDMVSRRSATPFWGTGIYFDDNDIKYLISMFSVGSVS